MPSTLLHPNRALTRAKLEALAWQVTPSPFRDYRDGRRRVVMTGRDGATSVELSSLTDNQLRKYIGPRDLEEAGDMQKNGRGIYHGTDAKRDDYVIYSKSSTYHPEGRSFYVDRVEAGGKHTLISKAKGDPTVQAAITTIRKDMRDADTNPDITGIWIQTDEGLQRSHFALVESDLAKNGRREQPDETAARELSLFIENDYDLVGAPNSQGKAIEKNLLAKIRNGTFDLELSELAWMHLMESGAKKYAKEFASPGDWSRMFNKPTRELVAHEFATSFFEEHGKR